MKFGTAGYLLLTCLAANTLETDATNISSLRIVNGKKAEKGRYDYYAQQSSSSNAFCGGFLIAPNVVLTAAHCNGGKKKNHAFTDEVLVGSYRSESDKKSGEFVDIKKIIQHPGYNSKTYELDVMLVVLENDSKYPPVCIADAAYDATLEFGTSLYTIGFGETREGGYSSNVMLEVNTPYLDTDQCSEMFDFDDDATEITDSEMCVYNEGGRDYCSGDSGGPLIRRGANAAEDIVVGIVSWSYKCADKFPAVYARIAEVYEWIKSNVEKYNGEMAPCASQPNPNYKKLGCYKYKNTKIFSKIIDGRKWSLDDCSVKCKGYKYFMRKGPGKCYCGNKYGSNKHRKSKMCNCGGNKVGKGGIGCVYNLQSLS